MIVEVFFVAVCYLVGSVSFARLVASRVAPDQDIAVVEYPVDGSDETWVYRGASATSVTEKIGLRWGLLVVAMDLAKGLVPTLLARIAWPDSEFFLVAAVAVIVGHVFPVWHRFHGGRGQSTIIGALIVIDPVALPFVILVGAVVGILFLTSVYHARNGFPLYLPLWGLVSGDIGARLLFGLSVSAVYLLAVLPDLREERRVKEALGWPGKPYRMRLSTAVRDFFSTEA